MLASIQMTAQSGSTKYPWSETFGRYGLNDSIAEIALSVSQGKPFYHDGAAAGLWALTPPVAIRYGLTVNSYIDQRFDPGMSAEAAAHYIADLILHYDNDTTMAVAAFRIGAALLSDTLALNEHYTPAGINFTYSGSATVDSIYNRTSGYRQIVASPVRISAVLYSGNISHRTFRLLNPSIRRRIEWLMPQQTVFLPDTVLLQTLYASEQTIYDSITNAGLQLAATQAEARQKAIKAANAEVIYIVRSGDTLGHIARKYKVSVRQIKSWNGLKSDMIRVGQKLRIKSN